MKNKIANKILNTTQKIIDRKYRKEGATKKVINAQVMLNEFRNKHDIPDENEIIYEDFVQ